MITDIVVVSIMRLKDKERAEKYKCIENMLREKKPIMEIVRTCGVSTKTVYKVKDKLEGKTTQEQIEVKAVPEGRVEPPPLVETPPPSQESIQVVEELNRKFYEKMRVLREDKRIPMLYKELQTLSWWHSVVHDVGVNTILLSLISSEIPESEIPDKIREWRDDPGRLVDHVLEFLGKAIEYRRGAIRLMQLEDENRKLRNMVEGLKSALIQYMTAYNTLASMTPDNIKLKFLVAFLVNQGLRPSPIEEEQEEGEMHE